MQLQRAVLACARMASGSWIFFKSTTRWRDSPSKNPLVIHSHVLAQWLTFNITFFFHGSDSAFRRVTVCFYTSNIQKKEGGGLGSLPST
jgi:hypothetical protein